jgi:hypothetical protein
MNAEVVVIPTGDRFPVGEMKMRQWFRPQKLHAWWPRAKGICQRLGQNPDGSVNCIWMERPGYPQERFTLPGGSVREVLMVDLAEAELAAA